KVAFAGFHGEKSIGEAQADHHVIRENDLSAGEGIAEKAGLNGDSQGIVLGDHSPEVGICSVNEFGKDCACGETELDDISPCIYLYIALSLADFHYGFDCCF